MSISQQSEAGIIKNPRFVTFLKYFQKFYVHFSKIATLLYEKQKQNRKARHQSAHTEFKSI